MLNWFYTENGKNAGPVSSKVIAGLVLKGSMDIDDLIVSEQDNTRCRIREANEIMEIVHKPLSHVVIADIDPAVFGDFKDADLPLNSNEPLFYNLPARTLLLVQLITCGMFEWYWFYKQWNYLRFHTRGRRGSYFLASIYIFTFAYRVFSDIETNRELNQVSRPAWNARFLALLWYLVIPLLFFNPLQQSWIITGIFSYLLVVMLTSLVLLPVQKYINDVNEKLKKPISKPSFGFYVVVITSLLVPAFGLVSFVL